MHGIRGDLLAVLDPSYNAFVSSDRRTFLATSVAASASALIAPGGASAAQSSAGREFYELRAYRLAPGTPRSLLDGYLERALLPALDSRGVKNVGVFTEIEVDKTAVTFVAKADTPVWVLMPHATLDSFVRVSAGINEDAVVQKAGAAYLDVPKASPAFDRIDSWLLLAFKSMPQLELPAFSKAKTPTRVFEMRDYESHSERAALSKMAMFDNGETEIMRDLGMSPVFFGQALAGPNLPHLRYITSGPDLATHLASWKTFGPDPRWMKLRDDPQYKDNTSKNTARFLVPTAYSQI
jgi:hypothetical protein